MLIITAIGRCGTSFLARFCHEMGADIGEGRWLDGLDAGMEDPEVCSINNAIVNQVSKGKAFDVEKIARRIKRISMPIIKDPQFTYHPLVLETWLAARKDIKVVYLWRNPEDIAASCKSRPLMNGPNFRNHTDLIAEKQLEFNRTLKRNGVKFEKLSFPQFLHQDRKVIKLLNKLSDHPFHMTKSREVWEALRDEKKVHHGQV